MIVDDAKTIRRAGQMFLEEAGYVVAFAEDGFSALSAIQENRPDLILLDIMMPKLDGYQTCHLIKSNEDFKDIPVVMISSNDGPFDAVVGQLWGCDDYVTKPFKKDALLKTVKLQLEKRNS